MSEIEISSGESEDNFKLDVTTKNMNLFLQMLKLCQNNKMVPKKYIEDMNLMYNKCNCTQKNSINLCNLILEAVENISLMNENSFQYAANVYNALLELSKNKTTSLQNENDVASTSSITTGLENGTNNKSNEIFKEFISKCYENPKFPNYNIEQIDKLYKSLPSEFVDSKHFILILKEVNEMIWPDSSITLYVHVENVYEQLIQFKTSMEIQDEAKSMGNSEINKKKLIKLKKLQIALKKVRRKIKDLDSKEMDLDDDVDFDVNSPYILKDRYEKRALEIYRRMCKLREEPDYLEEPKLRFIRTDNSLVNKTIEKFYNINKVFPNYFEIYTLLKLLNEKKKLGWTEIQLNENSRDAFHKLGFQLKRQRLNEYFGRLANITTEQDPAETNMELKTKLDKSNKKLNADLDAIAAKFEKKQEYAEETEGSNISNTECENSSEDDCSTKNIHLNEKFSSVNNRSIGRKRVFSHTSEKDEPKNKSKKTIYMESFDLTSSNSPNAIDEETRVDTEIVPDNIIVSENISSETNKNEIIDIEKVNDEFSKIITENISDRINKEINVNSEKVTDGVSKTENINNGDGNLENNFVVVCNKVNTKDSHANEVQEVDNNDTTVAIEPYENEVQEVDNSVNTVAIEPYENEVQEVDNNDSAITIDSEDELIITEPEVIINESNGFVKDETNKFDNSDVVITTSTPKKVPVQNKKSIESIIKSMNFEQKYKWDQPTIQNPRNSLPSNHYEHLQQLRSANYNSNHQFVNRWIMNNVNPPRPNMNFKQHYRAPTSQRMHSTMQKSTTQTERQITQRVSNTIQQQRNFMSNQSVQQVTTMTTTTTVRQVVQKSSEPVRRRVHRPVSSQSNINSTPELIELD